MNCRTMGRKIDGFRIAYGYARDRGHAGGVAGDGAALRGAVGYGTLGFSDHVVIARGVESKYPYNEQGVWPAADTGFCLEQLMTIAHVAAVTSKIRN